MSQKNIKKDIEHPTDMSQPDPCGMKVLMISGDKKILNTSSRVYQRMKLYAESLGDKLIICVPTYVPTEEIVDGYLSIKPVTISSKLFGFFKMRKAAQNIAQQINERFIVTSQDPFYFGLIAASVAKRNRAPLEIQIHTDIVHAVGGNVIKRWLAVKNLKAAHSVRAVSKYVLDKAHVLLNDIDKKTYILPVAADIKDVKPAVYTKENPVVLVVSRLEREKNVSRALAIFRKLKESVPSAQLRIAGEGSLANDLYREAVHLGIDGDVVFLGFVDDISREYEQAQILLHTSDYEGFGVLFVEAAAAALPIIATKTGIASEITDYVYGSDNIEQAVIFAQKILMDQKNWLDASISTQKKGQQFMVSPKDSARIMSLKWRELGETS